MPIYIYKCPECEEITTTLREIPDVYDDVICDDCGHTFDGKKHKLVEGGMTVLYEQGSLKGKM